MKNIKKYEKAKRVAMYSAILFCAFTIIMYNCAAFLSKDEVDSLFQFFDIHPVIPVGALFVFSLPLFVAIFALGLLLKYRESRFMILRFPLYFVSISYLVIELVLILLAAFGFVVFSHG